MTRPVIDSRDRVPASPRNVSVDVLRGIVMILMALDHVRDYTSGAGVSPTDLARTTPALFFTRWITHYCAPTFVFLAGTGAYLSLGRGKERSHLSRFLWTRGLFLIVLELTLVRLAWTFNFDYRLVWVQVIWALGVSMIVLALLVRLPDWFTAAFGLAMVFGHNLLDGVTLHHQGILLGASARDWIVAILHVQRPPIVYPLIPWIGVMAAGFAFGKLFAMEQRQRVRAFLAIGASAIALFVILRFARGYGDPRPWNGEDGALGVMSFLNVSKYPPSLAFLLMTLGPAVASLALLERATGAAGRVFSSFGRAPLFFYLTHIVLAHALAVVLGVLTGFRASDMCVPFFMLPKGYGFSLGVVYVAWVGVVVALYLPTRWWAELKARNRQSVVLSYL